jgi:hypothetical protein
MAALAAAAMTVSLVGSRAFLAAHDRTTDALTAEIEQRAGKRMAQMREDARVFSKNLGFNILLLPEGQDAGRLYAEDRSTTFFAAKQIATLAGKKIETLNHLLPMLRQRVTWKEYGGDIVIVGIQGEIHVKGPGFQKPIEERIEPGDVHVGDAIRQRMGLKTGSAVTLLGENFTVRRLIPQKGNVDDIAVLMNLTDAQRLLEMPDRVSGVLALICLCAEGNLDLVRRELSQFLPGLQVVEFTVQSRARMHARTAIARSTKEEIEDIRTGREELRRQIAAFSSVLVVVVFVGSIVLLLALTAANARERRTEVALLRALGLPSGGIVLLFVCKAVCTGLVGAVAGVCVGLAGARWLSGPHAAVGPAFAVGVVAAALAVAVGASIVPALLVARADPAGILKDEP